eukprot:gb/GEZJ01003862.1/.p1 GENE.gb/GEZJ01003862.1/~~gb/GEZJ01003862.1/.p1  ORF type:complete len:152 (+),score=11.79 gb/GEZJ01003862.1/:342-797(+)
MTSVVWTIRMARNSKSTQLSKTCCWTVPIPQVCTLAASSLVVTQRGGTHIAIGTCDGRKEDFQYATAVSAALATEMLETAVFRSNATQKESIARGNTCVSFGRVCRPVRRWWPDRQGRCVHSNGADDDIDENKKREQVQLHGTFGHGGRED